MEDHFSVAGVARNGDSVLVMRRLPGGSVGGKWEFPGGKTERGETAPAALQREWLEETGLSITVGKEIARSVFHHLGRAFTLIAFEVFLPKPDSIPRLLEHDSYCWMDITGLLELDLVDSDRKVARIIAQERA